MGFVNRKRAEAPQEDRLPLETYDQAVWRIVQRRFEGIGDEAFDELCAFVADTYWVTDKKVRRDVYVSSRKLGGY